MGQSIASLMKKLKNEKVKAQGKNHLSEKQICYVLITCEEPNNEGEMHVEMTYEGDRALASYLIQSAQGMLDG